MIDSALASIQADIARHYGRAVTYIVGQTEIPIPDAVMGQTDYESDDINGATLRSIVTDWLIAPARLVINDQPVEPESGHRVRYTDINDMTRTYEVQPLGNDGCFRFSGPSRDRYRIHVREIPT